MPLPFSPYAPRSRVPAARVREACEQARVHRYPEAWQSAHQLSRLETALQQIEARVLDLGTPSPTLSRR